MTKQMKRRGFLRALGLGSASATALGVAGVRTPQPVPSQYPEGTTGWAREQIVAGHRVRQRCWKDGAGCEMPDEMVCHFGKYYEKGITKFTGMPVFMDMMVGNDWEIVS